MDRLLVIRNGKGFTFGIVLIKLNLKSE